jgi:hypothetical protein
MTARHQFLRLLRQIAAEVESLTDEEFEAVLEGKSGRRLVRVAAVRKKKASRPLDDAEVGRLSDELAATSTREAARALLTRDEGIATRANLERIARALRMHVNKHDTRDALIEKIVEAVVGVRLRSEAIRGLSLKGSGSGSSSE